jgi:hypothetical protein
MNETSPLEVKADNIIDDDMNHELAKLVRSDSLLNTSDHLYNCIKLLDDPGPADLVPIFGDSILIVKVLNF